MTQSLPMTAPPLALELRQTIARWFSTRDTPAMQISELILSTRRRAGLGKSDAGYAGHWQAIGADGP